MKIVKFIPYIYGFLCAVYLQADVYNNSGFESGSSGNLWGGSSVVTTNAYSGSYAAELGDSSQWGGGYEETISGLTPNTTYEFSAFVKSNGGTGSVGAKDFGGVAVNTPFSSSSYQMKVVRFTTGPSSTGVKIYVYNPPAGGQYMYVDDLALYEVDDEYSLIFSDEFNGNGSIDTSVWTPEIGFHRNNEEQYYLPANLEEKNGNLVITAKRETVSNANYDPSSPDWRLNREFGYWTSGSINTIGKFSFLYGRVECRAKVTNFLGTWPAIWTVGQGEWPAGGEIDIMENYQDKILANYAVAASGRWSASWDSSATSVGSLGGSAWSADYHIWSMDWSPNRIAIYLDGQLLNEFDPSTTNSSSSYDRPGIAPFQTSPQSLWLNLAVGGGQGGNTSGLPNETEYLVDYIRVYQKAAVNNLLGNAGFEVGSSPYLWGGSLVVSSNQRSGNYAARLDDNSTWGGGYEALITGLAPNTTYRFSGWVKTTGSEGRLGVKDYGGADDYVAFTNSGYDQMTVQFTTGTNNTSAKVYVYNPPGGSGVIYADDLVLALE